MRETAWPLAHSILSLSWTRRDFALVFAAVLLASCSEPSTKLDTPSDGQTALRPIHQWWSDERQDYWLTASDRGNRVAPEIFRYKAAGVEDLVSTHQTPGTIPLQLYWSEEHGDNRNVADEDSISQAIAAGYEFKATEGYVLAIRQSGTVPLNLYWNAKTRDSATTSNEALQRQLLASGYSMVRTEGFVWRAADEGQNIDLR